MQSMVKGQRSTECIGSDLLLLELPMVTFRVICSTQSSDTSGQLKNCGGSGENVTRRIFDARIEERSGETSLIGTSGERGGEQHRILLQKGSKSSSRVSLVLKLSNDLFLMTFDDKVIVSS